jgi:hypothetical protein
MMNHNTLLAALLLAGAGLTVGACDDTPTTAVVVNAYPAAGSTVTKVWWLTTLFPNAIDPGATSETERTVPGTDFAYALLAGAPPARPIALKSRQKLTAAAHEPMTIVVSDDTFAGDCAAGSTLDPDDARLITEQIFPGDFAGASYDPATCASP